MTAPEILDRIASVVAPFDIVALQEVDSGSLRSRYVNQVRYLAEQAGFPHWYTQLNRDLGPFAQHGNGLLCRYAPRGLEDHKLPGVIPGRGAILIRMPFGSDQLTLVMLHLSLGERSRRRQLEYVRALIQHEERVVVMGDMNSHLGAILGDSPLSRAYLKPAGAVTPTYPAWRPTRALDHILVSADLAIRDFRVLDCRFSDHLPIAVTVDHALAA
ncbi:MAG: endonuclease/exonuclease/phosphatase family protein [Pseudomonadales bacterium]